MAVFKTYPMNNSTILRINFEKAIIDTNPDYQRNGDIWTLEKRQLLLDSILNDFDIPKLYFHVLPTIKKRGGGQEFAYAIIDGRQRLETIWSFIQGEFPLAADFKYFKDDAVQAADLTYADLSKKYQKLKIIFDSFVLPIVLVETDDVELIEDMFSRLNEAVPLNAAEKRNAIGGPMAKTINRVSGHDFFSKNVKFSNRRYQYKEVAARLLYLEDALREQKRYYDTKKPYLDAFVRKYKADRRLKADALEKKVRLVLDEMHGVFTSKDSLLRSQSIIPIYYLLFRDALTKDNLDDITRAQLVSFRDKVDQNRTVAEQDITKADFELLEFDRMSQQGTNDSASIRDRFRIISHYLTT